jgi:hypothetical protein
MILTQLNSLFSNGFILNRQKQSNWSKNKKINLQFYKR